MPCSAELELWIKENTAGSSCVVDLGAGKFDKLKFVPPGARKWGVEIFGAYLGFAPVGINAVFGDFTEWERYIPENARDTAMLIDSLEHIKKFDGMKLLDSLKDHFRKILVFTPLGFHPQEDDATGFDNEWQKHECGWHPAELEAFGFEVRSDEKFHGEKGGAIFATWERK